MTCDLARKLYSYAPDYGRNYVKLALPRKQQHLRKKEAEVGQKTTGLLAPSNMLSVVFSIGIPVVKM